MTIVKARGVIALVIAALLSGASFAVTKDALSSLPPSLLVALRVSLATLVSVGIIPRSRTIAPGIILGVLAFAGLALQTVGLMSTTATKAGFIAGFAVVLTPLMLAALTRSRPSLRVLFALYAALSGLALLTSNPLTFTFGDVWVLAGALFYAFYLAYLSRVARQHSALVLSAVQLWPMVVLAWLWALPELPYLDPIPTSALWQLLFLGLMVTALAAFLRVLGQRSVAPFWPPLLLLLEPLIAAGVATWLLGERLPVTGYIGGVLVLVAMLLGDFRWYRRKPTSLERFVAVFIDLGAFSVGSGRLQNVMLHDLLAVRLHNGVRRSDHVEALASKRYALLLASTGDRTDARRAAERILTMLRAPFDDERSEVAVPPPGAVMLGTSGYRKAYQALQAVPKERGQPIKSSPEYRAYVRALEFLRRDADMRWGLQDNAFIATYTPLAKVQDVLPEPAAAITAARADLLWKHPERGDMDASQFMPLAVTTGFANKLELYLLERVLNALAASPPAASPHPLAFVVVPLPVSLLAPEGIERVRLRLSASNVDLSRLKFALIEDTIAANLERVSDVLADLASVGVGLVLQVSLSLEDDAILRARQYLPLLPIDFVAAPAEVLVAERPQEPLANPNDEVAVAQAKRDYAKQQQQYEARLALEQLTDFVDAKVLALAATRDQLAALQASTATLLTSDVLPARASLDEVTGK